MANVNGCEVPEDLYYLIDKHVWAKPMEGSVIRIGMTQAAGKMSGGNFAAVTVSARKVGKELAQGKSVATVESSKFVGPVPTPVTGTLLRGNEALESNPNIVVSDPYGEGWIAEMEASDWDGEASGLVTGSAAVDAYQAKLEADGFSCE